METGSESRRAGRRFSCSLNPIPCSPATRSSPRGNRVVPPGGLLCSSLIAPWSYSQRKPPHSTLRQKRLPQFSPGTTPSCVPCSFREARRSRSAWRYSVALVAAFIPGHPLPHSPPSLSWSAMEEMPCAGGNGSFPSELVLRLRPARCGRSL